MKTRAQNREDGPMQKVIGGMVACGHEILCAFGGYGPDTSQHQPETTYHFNEWECTHCWTNELHLFHIETGQSVLHV